MTDTDAVSERYAVNRVGELEYVISDLEQHPYATYAVMARQVDTGWANYQILIVELSPASSYYYSIFVREVWSNLLFTRDIERATNWIVSYITTLDIADPEELALQFGGLINNDPLPDFQVRATTH